jgi:hypothetical protein
MVDMLWKPKFNWQSWNNWNFYFTKIGGIGQCDYNILSLSLSLCIAGSFSTIYDKTSMTLRLIKITEVIKEIFVNNISTVFKLYY